jgi:hypothetical protein
MSQKNVEYRSAKGKRLEGHSLAARMSKEIVNVTLAHAFIMAKTAGIQFHVAKYEGIPSSSFLEKGIETINVVVVKGLIRKSWVDVP